MSASTNGEASGADAVPNFSDSALANLTSRIQQGFQKDSKPETKPKPGKKEKNNKDQKPKKDQANDSQQQLKPDNTTNKGQKRDRKGEPVVEQKHASGKQEKKGKNVKDDETLRQEILAFGGTEDDYNLLAGVDSDSEYGNSGNNSEGAEEEALRSEMARMMKGFNPNFVMPELPKKEAKPAKEKVKKAEAEKPQPQKQEKASSSADEETTKPAQQKQKDVKEKKEQKEKQQKEKQQKEKEQKEKKDKEAQKPQKKEEKKEDAKKTEKAAAPKKEQALKAKNSRFMIEPRPDWHATELPSIAPATHARVAARHVIDQVHEYANSLLEAENKEYSAIQDSSTHKFYSTIVTTGTLSDKTSALTLAIQESPLHNTKSLDSLVGLAKKRSRAQAVEVLRSLKDLFAQGDVLPSSRRLRAFHQQPALVSAFADKRYWSDRDPLPGDITKAHLVYWAYEDYLKEQYFEILKILEVWCNDEIEFSRSRAVSYVFELLKEKPEQETNLLRLLVNKLGDPNKKIASRASYLLLQLEQAHPLMKLTVINAIEADILFRPNQSQHAKYYAVITLNQTILSRADEKVAAKLLDIYFGMFVSLLKPAKQQQQKWRKDKKKSKAQNQKEAQREAEKGQAQEAELREKLVAGVLTGVNRAYPFMSENTERLSNHINTLFRITHSSNFNTSIQALMLIQQLTHAHQVGADRFYRTLYESLLDPRITTSSKQPMYLNLLYKALKADLNVKRVKAFVKRLVQILVLQNPSFVCGVMFLIRELEKTFPSLSTLIDEPEFDEDEDEEVFRDVPDEEGGGAQAQAPVAEEEKKKATNYDPRKRDPEHSNADKTCLWELLPYLSHFHPAVSVNASHLVEHKAMSGKADLSLHTLIHFLDRFVYRNPKQSVPVRGASIMQPLAGGDTSGLLVTSGGARRAEEPVNSEAFWQKKGGEVAAEDVFFHDYFNRLGEEKHRKQKKKDAKKGGEEEDESDAESEVWQALVDSRPELEGADASDDDLDLDELDEAMESDEGEGEGASEGEGDEGVIFNDESDRSEDEGEEQEGPPEDAAEGEEDDDEPFGLEGSDDEALVDEDADLPSDLDVTMEDLMAGEADESEGKPDRGKKRRKLKHLPMFASADDYAKLLEQEDEGM